MFKKTKEDFKCQNCGKDVFGDGFTNHCPDCLYSKHVDIDPGDRLSKCGGLMEPINVVKNGREYSLIHRCNKCGYEKTNKCQKEDNFNAVLQIALENSKYH